MPSRCVASCPGRKTSGCAAVSSAPRTTYLTDGALLTWEYPRVTPDGEQMDLVEVMEIRDGLIAHHRVYWGWRSVGMLTSGTHPR